MICWLGDVEACVNTASLKACSWQVVVLVGHQHHRALSQRGHRLVRRVRLVDAQLGLARIRYEPGVEHARVLGIEVRAERLLLREVPLQVRRVGEGLLQVRARAHRGARAVERREAGEAEPGLVPEEDQVGLDREALFHHAAHVVDVAVEGAVGQRDRLHLVEPARRLEVEQRLLDGCAPARRRTSSTPPSGRPRRSTAGPPPAPCRSGATCGSCGRRSRCRPASSSAWWTILLEVEVPLVTKNTRSAPKARAAASWAFLMLPVGSSRLSRPPESPRIPRGTGWPRRTRPCRGSSST